MSFEHPFREEILTFFDKALACESFKCRIFIILNYLNIIDFCFTMAKYAAKDNLIFSSPLTTMISCGVNSKK